MMNADFIKSIETTKLLEEPTKNNYIRKINIVLNEFFNGSKNIDWILDHPEIFKIELIEYGSKHKGRIYDTLSNKTLCTFIGPFMSLILSHREIQERTPNLLSRWKKIRSELESDEINNLVQHKPNERQEKSYVKWEEIIKIRDQLPANHPAKLLIHMYTEIPPVRSDFDQIRIYQRPINGKTDENYIVLGYTNCLYLGEYKTSHKYGQIEVPLPNTLITMINESLERNPRQSLFQARDGEVYKSNTWNNWANRLLKKVYGHGFSLTMFRHSYLSQPELIKLPIEERRRIAQIMGHEITRQNYYDISDIP